MKVRARDISGSTLCSLTTWEAVIAKCHVASGSGKCLKVPPKAHRDVALSLYRRHWFLPRTLLGLLHPHIPELALLHLFALHTCPQDATVGHWLLEAIKAVHLLLLPAIVRFAHNWLLPTYSTNNIPPVAGRNRESWFVIYSSTIIDPVPRLSTDDPLTTQLLITYWLPTADYDCIVVFCLSYRL